MTNFPAQKNYLTTETRWLTALSQIQEKQVLVFDNFPTCCGSCAGYEIEQEHEGKDYVYFINQQGRGITFKNGVPYNFELEYDYFNDDDNDPDPTEVTRLASKVYWSHSSLRSAQATADAFKANGFTVDWDGTDFKCVTVEFPI